MKKKTLSMALLSTIIFSLIILRTPMLVYAAKSFTLRPNWDGILQQWKHIEWEYNGTHWNPTTVQPVQHFWCVNDDPNPNYDPEYYSNPPINTISDYVYFHGFTDPSGAIDSYELNNPVPKDSKILSVQIFAWARMTQDYWGEWELELWLIINGIGYTASPTASLGVNWADGGGYLMTVNPATLQNWTWNDIEELEVGIVGIHPLGHSSNEARVTQVYVIVKAEAPVGGIVIPVDKFGLLAPYIGLASTIIVATVATSIYAKHVRRKEEKQ